LEGNDWTTYTALPYLLDRPGCAWGYNVNGKLSPNDAVTIVAGHEYAESVTDPSLLAWKDPHSGQENADKCTLWLANVALDNGTFPMQATWSNYHQEMLGAGCKYYTPSPFVG
jgi:hypothetical protein